MVSDYYFLTIDETIGNLTACFTVVLIIGVLILCSILIINTCIAIWLVGECIVLKINKLFQQLKNYKNKRNKEVNDYFKTIEEGQQNYVFKDTIKETCAEIRDITTSNDQNILYNSQKNDYINFIPIVKDCNIYYSATPRSNFTKICQKKVIIRTPRKESLKFKMYDV